MAKPLDHPASADDILRALETLSRHVEGLQREAHRLAARIIPVEGENNFNEPFGWLDGARHDIVSRQGKPLTIKDTHDLIRRMDSQLRDAELDIGFIRAKVDAIANSSFLTADWQEWMRSRRSEVSK